MFSFSVGEHDGIFQNKRFFKCPDKHGVIVPLEAVHLLVPSDVCLGSKDYSYYTFKFIFQGPFVDSSVIMHG